MRSAFLALVREARSEQRPRSEGLAARSWRFFRSALLSLFLVFFAFILYLTKKANKAKKQGYELGK